jgi:hypothetical protein
MSSKHTLTDTIGCFAMADEAGVRCGHDPDMMKQMIVLEWSLPTDDR